MKILFLDIDGVLNSEAWAERNQRPDGTYSIHLMRDFDRDAVKVLNTIIEKSGARVVISSSWRILHSQQEITDLLVKHGFIGEVIGMTPKRSERPPYRRGNEIQAWLDANPSVTKFVIIDDDSDMEHLLPMLVQTSWFDGLLERHIEPALKVLS